MPVSGYLHPRARVDQGAHDRDLEVSADSEPNYQRWIASLCEPHLGSSVLELGAGRGAVTQHLIRDRSVVAVDLSDDCVSALRERFANNPNVRVVQGDAVSLELEERFDSVLAINVLEHIRDDSMLLVQLKHFVKPGGNIVLWVPAFNGLYTAWDRKVGHYRRYSRARLTGVIREAGLSVVTARYVQLLGLFAWSLSGVFARSRRVGGGLKLWDSVATPVSRAIESAIRIPIGLNVFCVAIVNDR